jgi:hypothetical protein
MSNTCGRCKHWVSPFSEPQLTAQGKPLAEQFVRKVHGICDYIPTIDIMSAPPAIAVKAYITSDIDGSPLYTVPSFGCNLWEKAL